MKNTYKSTIMFISILLMGFLFSTTAAAGFSFHASTNHIGFSRYNNSYSHKHRNNRHHSKYKYYNRYSNYKYNKHKRNYYYNNSYQHHNYNSRYNNYKHYGNYSNYNKPCHQVSKVEYDEYGVSRKIGGTLCYNQRGESYIVKGSRYYMN